MAERHPLIVRLLWWLLYTLMTGLSLMMIYFIISIWADRFIGIEVDNTVNYKEFFPFPAVTVCSTTKIVADRFNLSKLNEEYPNISLDSQGSEILNNIKLLCNEYERLGEMNVTSVDVIQIIFQSKLWVRSRCKSSIVTNKIQVVKTAKYLNNSAKLLAQLPVFMLDVLSNCDITVYLAPRVSEVIDSDETFTPIITRHGLCFSHNMLDGREIFREDVNFHNNRIEHGNLVKGWTSSAYGFYSINNFSIESEEEGDSKYPKEMSDKYNLKFSVKSVPQDNEFKCKSEVFQFKVLFHNPAELPFLIEEDSTTFLADQFIAMSVKPEVISTDSAIISLDPEKKQCYSSDQRNLLFFRTYTESNCFIECLTNITLSHCNCVTFYMPRLNTMEICSAKQLNCTKAAEDLFDNGDFCECLPSCLTLYYKADIFTQYWPGFHHSSNLTIKSSPEYFFVAYTRKSIYDINTLISDIGGINGFFTGVTVSSVVKFLYFSIWKVLRNLYGFIRKGSKRQ